MSCQEKPLENCKVKPYNGFMLHQKTLNEQLLNQRILRHQHVTASDIHRIIRRDYMWDAPEIKFLLDQITDAPEKYRVQAAILKLGDKNLKRVIAYFDLAKTDCWSVIFFAEYPNFYHIDNNTPEKREHSIHKDWNAYQDWLNKAL